MIPRGHFLVHPYDDGGRSVKMDTSVAAETLPRNHAPARADQCGDRLQPVKCMETPTELGHDSVSARSRFPYVLDSKAERCPSG
jgi:hypothetical protein